MSINLTCLDTSIDENQNITSSFIIEPLETGQGITLGNSLRRTLLSDLTGFAITGARINNLKHEFAIVEGIREDILEILLNLKEVIFKPSLTLKERVSAGQSLKYTGFLKDKGPKIITAGLFYLPKDIFKIVNPHQYICTIVDNSEFYLEIDIENGKGCRLIDNSQRKINQEQLSSLKPATLLIDSIFIPVKKVNYKIKLIHDSYGNIKESLYLEILTDGSITPKRSLLEAVKILMNLFYPLLLTPELSSVASKISTKLNDLLEEN